VNSEESDMAQQILEAVKKGSVPTPRFKPKFLQNTKNMDMIRLYVKFAVFGRWNTKKEFSTLLQIYNLVSKRIKDYIATAQYRYWSPRWRVPGKRTVDRRVNECADKRFWDNEITPIIALKAGLYMPNPALFEGEIQDELNRILFFEGKSRKKKREVK
jgi:hypothetical protein